MKFISFIESFNSLSVFFRLMIATLSGAVIGLERGAHGKTAGIRTFALVCLGASLVMVTNEYLVNTYSTGDPARLGAQVISGVGFLGVGTIIVTGRNYVKGLTTAASLWATACLGIAIGTGYITGGIMAMVMILFVMTVLSFVNRFVDDHARSINCYMEIDKERGIEAIYQYVSEHDYRIRSIDKQKKQALHVKDIAVIINIDLCRRMNHAMIVENMNLLESIHYIEEIR